MEALLSSDNIAIATLAAVVGMQEFRQRALWKEYTQAQARLVELTGQFAAAVTSATDAMRESAKNVEQLTDLIRNARTTRRGAPGHD